MLQNRTLYKLCNNKNNNKSTKKKINLTLEYFLNNPTYDNKDNNEYNIFEPTNSLHIESPKNPTLNPFLVPEKKLPKIQFK